MTQKKLQNLKEAATGSRKRHNILLRRRTNKEKVGADDGRDTIQKFHRDLRKALKTQRRRNKPYTVDPKYGRWIPKNRYNVI